jgi:hypothetical protein
MKKIVIIFVSIIFTLILLLVIYWHLPWQIRYKSEINFGNQLIEKIEKFRLENDSIPHSENREILESFGFEMTESFLPIYTKINETDYELIYCWGFDPLWLYYYSNTKEWEYK